MLTFFIPLNFKKLGVANISNYMHFFSLRHFITLLLAIAISEFPAL